MLRINVLVAATSRDLKAEFIAEAVAARPDMDLVVPDVFSVPGEDEADALVELLQSSPRCAVVLVGHPSETNGLARRCLAARDDVVVLHVDVADSVVRIAVSNPSTETLLSALRELVERVTTEPRERIARVELQARAAKYATVSSAGPTGAGSELLHAATAWVHQLLENAVERTPESDGFSVARATLLQSLRVPFEHQPETVSCGLAEADAALERALEAADEAKEPLARAARAFELGDAELRALVLALAPELDTRFQRCIGFLLDDMGRRAGTPALYGALLGSAARFRGALAHAGALGRWLAFEACAGRPAAADEPLRVDPPLARWLLGDRDALAADPRLRRALRLVAWPGAVPLQRDDERASASELLRKLRGPGETRWILLHADAAGWRALLELGAAISGVAPIRVEPVRLAGSDLLEIEECACRIGRMARLTGDPLVVDLADASGTEADGEWMRVFLSALGATGSRAVVICGDPAGVIRLLGSDSYESVEDAAIPPAGRVAAIRSAADACGAYLDVESARSLAERYPVGVDGFELAMRLAVSRPLDYEVDDPRLSRFLTALRQVAAEGSSRLAERVEPIFRLEDVVLPADRTRQLVEIVDNVRLASRVLDGWNFRSRLAYGRGVSALFHGASGTGKTMAALAIANRLGVQMLRLDLSRVVSKYIGDTEKNIDRVFDDAQKSGAAVLIDEADALLGKRSEVKDAHDRYANIEVAYLLQRMEAYEGLAILTTNLRQNVDPAFVRRLRFIIDFPRPDAEAREKIWRQCLPEGTHVLGEVAFRQLSRRIELTGGHIRQITLRAAFLAAAAGSQIGLEHVAHATRAELAKLGMAPVDIEAFEQRKAA